MIMTSRYLYPLLLVCGILVDVLVFPLTPVRSSIQQDDGWVQPSVVKHPDTNLTTLLGSGFWGEVDPSISGVQKSRELTEEERQSQQLQALIKQIKAVIVQGKKELVLAQEGAKSFRVAQGERLVDSSWVFADAGGDWIELKNTQTNEIRKLKLFTSALKR